MSFGRPLGRLKDTIYFTHSHHSRFLQVADMIVYMANRYENNHQPKKWHDKKLQTIWKSIKENTDFAIKRWPTKKERPAQNREQSLKGAIGTSRLFHYQIS